MDLPPSHAGRWSSKGKATLPGLVPDFMELMLRMIPLLDPLQFLSTCTQLLMLILWMMRICVVRQGQQFAIYALSRDRSHILHPRNGVMINILKM